MIVASLWRQLLASLLPPALCVVLVRTHALAICCVAQSDTNLISISSLAYFYSQQAGRLTVTVQREGERLRQPLNWPEGEHRSTALLGVAKLCFVCD